ncbi:DUF58 domain-containing protein [Rhizobium sp. KVB221]|uniref:DUF58 domain-containing protein n=1 Tax=Rhizobium setariae TaxID=2801340 RepID=A0A936YJP5_9HYPH|nr:DUF58 domain-containing protein [Rhizobium setariae]MBL0371530.1 DUF58 domain-containing protein [Rhizobium setariae]
MATSPTEQGRPDAAEGAYVSTQHLVSLEHSARDMSFVAKKPVQQLLAGRLASRIRGRGLTFEEVREYMPGDDIRSIDWRVTARTGKAAVRVYDEEKERPALILVDQRANMFFGSKLLMKSVSAAEAAALCAWRILGSGDRVGGVVFNDTGMEEVRPHRSRAAVIGLCDRIAGMNQALNVNLPEERGLGQLDRALTLVANLAHHDHLIVVISDFDGHGPATRDLMLRLAVANDVVSILVYDPFLLNLPTSGQMVISGGRSQAELSFRDSGMQTSIRDFARNRGRELMAWQRELGMPMLPLTAAEDTAPQLRRLLQQAAWQQRRR